MDKFLPLNSENMREKSAFYNGRTTIVVERVCELNQPTLAIHPLRLLLLCVRAAVCALNINGQVLQRCVWSRLIPAQMTAEEFLFLTRVAS